jgi:hypothetical protein
MKQEKVCKKSEMDCCKLVSRPIVFFGNMRCSVKKCEMDCFVETQEGL